MSTDAAEEVGASNAPDASTDLDAPQSNDATSAADGTIPVDAAASDALASADGPEGAASADAGDASAACSSNGPLAMAGDYAASDGTQYWLRESLTAATFTVVPPSPAPASSDAGGDAGGDAGRGALPTLGRIKLVCPQWLGVVGTDGTVTRLDWATITGGLVVCERVVASIDAAATLAPAQAGDVDAGCAGGPWLSLAAVSP
jgi:hypothetical protein